MTNKGGKGFNKNFKGYSGRPQDTRVSKSQEISQNIDSTRSRSPENLRLGFIDLKEIPESVLSNVVSFLDSWGIRASEYSLIGILLKSLEPVKLSPLVIFNGQLEVVVLREEILTDSIENSTNIRSDKVIASEIYKSNGSKVLLRRSFISNTLGDVFKMSGGFSLERLVKLLYSTIDSLCVLHKKGLVHGHLTEWNVSAGIDQQGCLMDVGIRPDSASLAVDQLALSRLIEKAIAKVRVKREDLEDKKNLQVIVAPLLQSLSEQDESKRPSLEVVKSLFKDLVGLVLEDTMESSAILDQMHDPVQDMNLISEEPQEIPDDQVVISKSNTKMGIEEEHDNFPVLDEKAQILDFRSPEKIVTKKSATVAYSIYVVLFVLVCFLSFKVLEKFSLLSFFGQSESSFNGPLLGLEELQSSWNSGVPSKMREVARQAIYDSSLRDLAEEVIISPILLDQNSVKLVDASLVRVAFAKEWEAQLNSDDRRFILALALREILKDEFPADLPALSDLHPAILIAVLSSTESKIPTILNTVPANILESLPEPFGVAYQILLSGKSDLKASAEEVVSLAHIGTRGANDPVMLSNFLKSDFERRLSALAVMFSVNNTESLKILDIILNHPNVSLNIPATEWAKKVEILNWEGIEASDKLFLTAGVALRSDKVLATGQIARLFLNPSPRVRGYAVGLSIHQIPFKHKGAIDVLTLIQKVPDIIGADQLTLLAQILEDPDRTVEAHMKVVQSFIASEPPVDIAKTLLLANSKSTAQNVLDGSLSGYLSDRSWVPDQAELEILVGHHDKVARMYGYQSIFQLKDKSKALDMLKRSFELEREKEFKDQIQVMIVQLEGSKR